MTRIDTGELKQIAQRNFNRIPGARGDTTNAYIEKVIMWLAEWCGHKEFRDSTKPGYCALVLAPDIKDDSIPMKTERLLYFKEDSTPEFGGNVYITDYAINRVFRLENTCADLDAIVRILKENDLGNYPFVAFDTDSQLVFVFENGAKEITYKFPLRVDLPRPFTIDVFQEMLDDIYKDQLQYPTGYPPVWHEAKGRVPCKETELVIQGHVACILRARAQGSYASSSEHEWLTLVEQKNNAGRADISVYCNHECVVVSELKVLRHCRYPDPRRRRKGLAAAQGAKQKAAAKTPHTVQATTNKKWALRGARQAAGYKVATNAKSAALVLYDMRDNDADIVDVKRKCADADVRYLRYYLHNQLPAKA